MCCMVELELMRSLPEEVIPCAAALLGPVQYDPRRSNWLVKLGRVDDEARSAGGNFGSAAESSQGR